MLRDFFLGSIKIHILHHASRGPVYGMWFIDELSRHGYPLSAGTLYPILHALENQHLLKSDKQLVKGKIRKYYTISKTGEKILQEAKLRTKELMDELYENK
jgi:DNA-binding PadR family transcriptional regulator